MENNEVSTGMFQDEPIEKRAGMLSDHCDSMEGRGFTIRLTKEEREELKEEVVNCNIESDKLKDELATISKEYKAKIKKMETERKQMTMEIRQQFQFRTGPVYTFANFEDKTISEYDVTGRLIETRKMKPNERQTKIKQINPALTGTND